MYGIVDTEADITIIGGRLFKLVATKARFKKRNFHKPDTVPRNYDGKVFTLDGKMDLNCLKSTSAIKIATMKNMDNFCLEGKPSCATTKLTLFAVSKDEWDTKEYTGNSMKNILYVLQYAKRHLSG